MIPIGYVFRPTPEELLWILADKIVNTDKSVPPPEIRNLDLYEDGSNPWTILDGVSDDQPCYVLTKLRKVGPGQSRTKRTAGVGTWKEQSSGSVTVIFEGLEMKGLRRYFVFQPKKGSSYSRAEHGHWIMNEYSLGSDQDLVVCEIHNKDGSRSRSSKRKYGTDDDLGKGVVDKRMRSETRVLDSILSVDSFDRVPVEQCDDTRGGSSSRGVKNNVRAAISLAFGFQDQDGFKDLPPEFLHFMLGTNWEEQCDTRGGSKSSGSEDNVGSLNSSSSRVANSDRDRQGACPIVSVDSFDGDRGSRVEINPCVPEEQCDGRGGSSLGEIEDNVGSSNPLSLDFPAEVTDGLWDIPAEFTDGFWDIPADDPLSVLGTF